MKRKALAGLMVIGLLAGGAAISLFAGNGPGAGRNGWGFGYGGPPQSEQERAARQAACLERNGGVCPNGGPQANCPGRGMGPGKGGGRGWRHGLRDGSGPRRGAACPWINQTNPPATTQQ